MKKFTTLLLPLATLCIVSCSEKKAPDVQQQMDAELKRIDTLLKDTQYNKAMANALEAAYYAGTHEPVPALKDTTIAITGTDDKLATNLSGFYALECGLGYLCSKSGESPVQLLQKIAENKADSATIFTFNRFANATWKAAQPFRDLQRISRATFMVANFLPQEEIVKDHHQIRNAAVTLLANLQEVADSSAAQQWQHIKNLMQDKQFSTAMAKALHDGYYTDRNETAPAFITPADDTTFIYKSLASQHTARNVAGFYALECGLAYFAATGNTLPSDLLKQITEGKISSDDKMLLMRFANATWQSGQPFIGINRITRQNFIPFDLLSEDEKEKDMVQIKAAAEKLLQDIQP